MATQTAHPQRANVRLWLLALLGAAMLCILPISLFGRDDGGAPTSTVLDTGGARVAYLEFGRDVDTLWLASPANPKARQKLGAIPHAPDFGAVAALSPEGDRLAYTALALTMKPAPDAPAGLWLTALSLGSQHVQLASSVDLLVKPLWSPDGGSLVYRRSAGGSALGLYLHDLASQTERELVDGGSALFPVAFTPAADALYYVSVRADASDLHRLDVASGETSQIARLADTLTRDWALAPAGDRLAYLEMSFSAGLVSSRGRVLEIASGEVESASSADADAFGPVWTAAGALTLGHDAAGETGGALFQQDGTMTALPAPRSGFDVPLAWSADKYLAVRRFDGPSAADPGRATLEVVTTTGGRTTIATGEVSFLGWITP